MLDRPKDPFAARAAGVAAAAAGDLEHAELYLKSALELEPLFAGARIALAEVYGAGGRKAGGCLELKALARPVMGQSKNAYQRGLLEFDRLELDRAEQDLCGKMRTGATTARTLKAR
jgi:predicted Zn-dependent protease